MPLPPLNLTSYGEFCEKVSRICLVLTKEQWTESWKKKIKIYCTLCNIFQDTLYRIPQTGDTYPLDALR